MRKKFLIILTYIAFFIYLFSMCALDSETYSPYITGIISGVFLIVRAYAEGWFERREM